MKIVIAIPELWSSKTEIVSWFIVGCLRRRGTTCKPADFQFMPGKGLTAMTIKSENCTDQERDRLQDCLLKLNDTLVQSSLAEQGRNTFLDDLNKFSAEDKKELAEYEQLFKEWWREIDKTQNQH